MILVLPMTILGVKLTTAYLLVFLPNTLQKSVDALTHTLGCGIDLLRFLIQHGFRERPILLVEDLKNNHQ